MVYIKKLCLSIVLLLVSNQMLFGQDQVEQTLLPESTTVTAASIPWQKLLYVTTGFGVVSFCLYQAYSYVRELWSADATRTSDDRQEQRLLSEPEMQQVKAFIQALDASDIDVIRAFDFSLFPQEFALILQWVQLQLVAMHATIEDQDVLVQCHQEFSAALRGLVEDAPHEVDEHAAVVADL